MRVLRDGEIMREELSTAIESIAARYPERRSALLPALHLVQQHSGGFVGAEDLAAIAEVIGVPVSEAYGVQTYYTMFQRKKLGKYHLQVDTNIPAMLAGAEAIVNHLERALRDHGRRDNRGWAFTLSTVECLASCGTCPVIQVNDRYYESMTPERTDALLASLRQGVMPDMPVVAHFHSECGVLMARRGMPNATDIDVYVASGGYRAIDRALEMEPAKVVGEVKASNLRGRGVPVFPPVSNGVPRPRYRQTDLPDMQR